MQEQIAQTAANLIAAKQSEGSTQTVVILESQYSTEFLSWLTDQGLSGEITFCGYPRDIDWSGYIGTDTTVTAANTKVISLNRDWMYAVNLGNESQDEYIVGSHGTMNSILIKGF